MARNRFSYSTEGEIALTAATARTVLQIASPANIGVAVRGLAVSFDGISGSAEPGLVELIVQTAVLGGTPAAGTAAKDDDRVGTTVQSLGKKWASGTTEPTDAGAAASKRDWHVHPQTGVEFRWWLDEEIVIAGGSWIGVRINMPAAVNCRARLFCEE